MELTDQKSVSRRAFLQRVAVGTVAATLLSRGKVSAVPQHTGATSKRSKQVLILGAGLAGLAAAWELKEAGHEVTVLEARTRPGGRVFTLRDPFADGLHAEAGAVAFSAHYTYAKRYIDALGLKRVDWVHPDLKRLYHLKGRRFAVGSDEQPEWPYALTEEEQKLGPMGILGKYFAQTLPSEVSDPERWNKAPLADLDKMTVGEYMRSQGASQAAVELIRKGGAGYVGFTVDGSALSAAMVEFGLWKDPQPFVVAGGNDRLPTEMANRLSRHIHYGVRVVAIEQTDAGVEVLARRGDSFENYRAEKVICTLPATVLRDVRFDPELPHDKQSAIANLPYLDTTRTYLQVNRAFWFDEGVSGSAYTDLPIQEVARQPYSDPGAADQRAILESHVRGPTAHRLAARSKHGITEHTLREMEKVHPKIRDHYEGSVVKAWSDDPDALSAYSWPAAGDVIRHLEPLQRAHDRIHFAGEHTSILRASMEGALRSGVRAAKEINATA